MDPNPIPPPTVQPQPVVQTPPLPSVASAKDGPPAKPKNWLLISLVTVIILLSLGATGFFAYQNYQLTHQPKPVQQTPTPPPTPDPTAIWKTYHNELSNYEIKYPSLWKFHYSPARPDIAEIGDNDMVILTPKDQDQITISGLKMQTGNSIQKVLQMRSSTVKGVGTIETKHSLNIKQYYQIIDDFGYKRIIIPLENDLTRYVEIDASATSLNQYINQILSTFKFLDQTPTPTCRPRPACLDATPRCMIPETSDMCPPVTKPTSTTYTCPLNGWVDCMPGPDPKPQCSAEAMAWYKANCPDFKGGAQ